MKQFIDKEVTTRTYELIAQHYEDNHKLTPENIVSLDKFVNYVKEGKVLDIGCADGLESDYLSKKHLQVTGIDISSIFISKASNKYPLVEFKTMDMEDLIYPNSTFNGIWASASFIHIPKERAGDVMSNFHRVLKKDGILFISTKFGNYNRLWKNRFMNWGERHFSHYTKKELCEVVEESGFRVLEINRNYVNWGNSWLHLFAKKV